MEAVEAPEGLREAGRALWDEVLADFDLAADERALLVQACRTVDELERIGQALTDGPIVVTGSTGQPKASGLFAEARAHRLVLGKLLEQLKLPAEGENQGKTAAQLRAQNAARTRWDLERGRHGAA